MEDAELYRSLRRCGRMRQSPVPILGSPRRYQQLGPYRTTMYYALILALYVMGAKMSTLTSVFRRLVNRRVGRALPGHSASLPGLCSAEVMPRSTTVPSGLRQ
jgi:hypothetical protein